MVATLIMFTAGRGIAQLITDGQITYVRVDSYKILGSRSRGSMPTPFIVAVVLVVVTAVILKKTALFCTSSRSALINGLFPVDWNQISHDYLLTTHTADFAPVWPDH